MCVFFTAASNCLTLRLQAHHGGSGMLILTRRVGETLRIGDDVLLTVRAIHGN
jgi:hypothetical protein